MIRRIGIFIPCVVFAFWSGFTDERIEPICALVIALCVYFSFEFVQHNKIKNEKQRRIEISDENKKLRDLIDYQKEEIGLISDPNKKLSEQIIHLSKKPK